MINHKKVKYLNRILFIIIMLEFTSNYEDINISVMAKMIGPPGKDHTFLFIVVSNVVMTITIKSKCFIARLYRRSLAQHNCYQQSGQTNVETGTKIAEFSHSKTRNDAIEPKEKILGSILLPLTKQQNWFLTSEVPSILHYLKST